MALARVKTWSSGEILTASDLNAEFNNLLNNARDLVSPLTASLDMNGFELILDGDADSSITSDTDDRLDIRLGGVDLFVFSGTTASSVNGVTFTGVITGTRPRVAATGSDTNVGLALRPQGTGAGASVVIEDGSGNEVLIAGVATASAVNEITVTNAATGGAPVVSATGGDSNIPLRLSPKGTGDVQFTDGSDVTKIVAWELSGLTTATTRTITVPDENITLGDVTKTGFTTGDVKLTLKTTADSGWVLMNDGTIGNATSGGTTRANADTESLFTLLWTNTADAQCAVSTGRGASAAADFAANKTIALPKALGRALAVYGAGSGLTSRALALAAGTETHELVAGEIPELTAASDGAHAHDVTVSDTGGGSNFRVASVVDSTDTGTVVNAAASAGAHTHTVNTGGGGGHANVQPTVFLNVMIKL